MDCLSMVDDGAFITHYFLKFSSYSLQCGQIQPNAQHIYHPPCCWTKCEYVIFMFILFPWARNFTFIAVFFHSCKISLSYYASYKNHIWNHVFCESLVLRQEGNIELSYQTYQWSGRKMQYILTCVVIVYFEIKKETIACFFSILSTQNILKLESNNIKHFGNMFLSDMTALDRLKLNMFRSVVSLTDVITGLGTTCWFKGVCQWAD